MSGPHRFRLVDSGVREAREHMAYDAALCELHEAGDIPDTVRFMRFPPSVLVGRHQSLHDEVHVERCRNEGVGLARRITGGGAIYLDEGQVGWEIVARRATLGLGQLADWAAAICTAVAAGLSQAFGIDARFRPRNDIEVAGRKIGGTGGYFSGGTLVYQGTVLVDMDAARMARLLNIPAAKLARHGADDARSRIVTLKELLGRTPSIDAVQQAVLAGLEQRLAIVAEPGAMTQQETLTTRRLLDEEIGSDSFVYGHARAPSELVRQAVRATPGGTITAHVRCEGAGAARRIREILLSGDFFVAPPRVVLDLEAHLRGVPVGDVAAEIAAFLAAASIGTLSLTAADFIAVVEDAVREPR